jgi:hypothetical protein
MLHSILSHKYKTRTEVTCYEQCASFSCQVAAWVPGMFGNFYFIENFIEKVNVEMLSVAVSHRHIPALQVHPGPPVLRSLVIRNFHDYNQVNLEEQYHLLINYQAGIEMLLKINSVILYYFLM